MTNDELINLSHELQFSIEFQPCGGLRLHTSLDDYTSNFFNDRDELIAYLKAKKWDKESETIVKAIDTLKRFIKPGYGLTIQLDNGYSSEELADILLG